MRILAGTTERIQTPALLNGSLVAQTGLTTVRLSIQRVSDGFWLDFADMTFKSVGWTTRQVQMTEVSATLAPGEYSYDLNTGSITNVTADDSYMVRVDETSAAAKNVPLHGEIKVDQWVADIRDATTAVNSRLPSDPADESQVQASIAAVKVDTAAILLDTDSLDTTKLTAGRANNLDNITSARLAELDAANLPADVDAILADTAAMQPAVATNLDATVSSRATQAQILSDATPFPGARIDATISSRATQAQILSDATPFQGARIDAAISSRSDFNEATDPVELLDSGGTAGTSAAELVVDIEANLSAAHGAGAWDGTSSDWTAAERNQIRDALGVNGIKATAVGGQVQAILADTDSLDTTKLTTGRAANLEQITFARMAELDAANMPADLDAVKADTDSLDTTKLTTLRANSLDQITAARMAELDAANIPADVSDILADTAAMQPIVALNLDAKVSTRSSHTPANVDTQLSGTHGAGSWEGAGGQDWTSAERSQMRDALGVDGAKTAAVGGQLQSINTFIRTKLLTVAKFLGLK